MISQALSALLEKHTGKAAEEEVVSYRNSICASCPRRRSPKGAFEVMTVRLEGIPGEPVLGDVCGACKCSLGLLNTATDKNIPTNPEEMSRRPQTCWIHLAKS